MRLSNWAGNVTYSAIGRIEPGSVAELQEFVSRADRLRAQGTGHSFNRIGDSDGVLVSVRGLPPGIAIDGDIATVPAGARYGEVAAALHAQGLALSNLGSLPHISVAGACATATHGSGRRNGSLATAVRGVELVRADGELLRIRRDDADFPAVAVSLGALGIVTRVDLEVEPTYDVAQDVWLDAPLDRVLENYDEIVSSAYSVSLFHDPRTTNRIDQIWVKRRDGAAPNGRQWGATPADRDVHPIAGQDARAATEQRGRPGPWHERLPHFRASFTPSSGDEQQSEFFVDIEQAPEAIAAVLRLDLSRALQVAEFRTVAADELWLSPFHDRATAALHFTWHDDDALVTEAVTLVENALAPFEPRPHWGKVFGLDPAQVRQHYPRLRDFRAVIDRYDPERKLGNAFLERFVY